MSNFGDEFNRVKVDPNDLDDNGVRIGSKERHPLHLFPGGDKIERLARIEQADKYRDDRIADLERQIGELRRLLAGRTSWPANGR